MEDNEKRFADEPMVGESPQASGGHGTGGVEPDEGLAASYRGCFFTAIGLVALALLALMLSSCGTTKYIEVPVTKTDTLIVVDHHRDSVYLHDSISVKEKGDTIWVQEWHTKYKLREVHDTTIVATHDTIAKPYPIIEYEEKPLTWWQRTVRDLGYLALGAIIIGILLLIFKITKR